MAGGIAIVIILLASPVIFAMLGVGIAALLGTLLHKDGERRHEGSELVDLNV